MALSKLRQVIVWARRRCEVRLMEPESERRGRGERGGTTRCTSGHGRGEPWRRRRQQKEITCDSTERGGGWRNWGRRRRAKCLHLSQGALDGDEATGGFRMHHDLTGEREQVEVKSPVLRRERAEEGSNIERHLEAFGSAHRAAHRGRGVPESGHKCMRRSWGWLRQRRGAHGAAAWRRKMRAWSASSHACAGGGSRSTDPLFAVKF
eukprot:1157081-Pleurochrysis_carterae.AAC.1